MGVVVLVVGVESGGGGDGWCVGVGDGFMLVLVVLVVEIVGLVVVVLGGGCVRRCLMSWNIYLSITGTSDHS